MKGSVLNADQKSKALDIARAVPGVRLVVNDLAVGDEAHDDVAPPTPRQVLESNASPMGPESTSNKLASQSGQRSQIQPVTALQSTPGPSGKKLGAKMGNTVIAPSAAMSGAAYQLMQNQVMMQQMQAAATQQVMQAQMIQTQMLQRELAEAKAMAGAAVKLRHQNPMAPPSAANPMGPHRMVNYCANGGCDAGGTAIGGGYASDYGGYSTGYGGEMGGYGGGGTFGGAADMGYGQGVVYDQAQLPGYAWPSYSSYPNYAALSYPKQYSPQAWPYIGPFYPYPQVPLGWRKVSLEWDDGWWMLDFTSK